MWLQGSGVQVVVSRGLRRARGVMVRGTVREMHDVWLGLRDEFLVGPVHTLRLPRQEGGKRLQAAVPTADRVKMNRFVRRAIRWGRLPLGFQTKRGRRKLDVDFMPALDEGTGEVLNMSRVPPEMIGRVERGHQEETQRLHRDTGSASAWRRARKR